MDMTNKKMYEFLMDLDTFSDTDKQDLKRILKVDVGERPLGEAVQLVKDMTQNPSDRGEAKELKAHNDEGSRNPTLWPEHGNKEGVLNDILECSQLVGTMYSTPTHKLVINRLQKANVPFYSNSNISEYLYEGEIAALIDEATEAYSKFMDCLVIDKMNDPNATDTPRRVAKMYINELLSGRYYPAPKATAFPNVHTGKESGFSGLLVVKVEFNSICSHHHQNVVGHMYIGIIPRDNVIGLSKYTRLAQWCARRGTLQEELAEDVAKTIQDYSGSSDIAVLIEGNHFCCEARGIMAHDSTTQTTVLKGDFLKDSTLRKEFHDNVMFQKMNKK